MPTTTPLASDVSIIFHADIADPANDDTSRLWFDDAATLLIDVERKLGVRDASGLVERINELASPTVHAAKNPLDHARLIVMADEDGVRAFAFRLIEGQSSVIAEAFDERSVQVSRLADQAEMIDAASLAMVCGKEIDRQVGDWSQVTDVDLTVFRDSVVFHADGDVTIGGSLELTFRDRRAAILAMPVVVTVNDMDDVFGHRSVDLLAA